MLPTLSGRAHHIRNLERRSVQDWTGHEQISLRHKSDHHPLAGRAPCVCWTFTKDHTQAMPARETGTPRSHKSTKRRRKRPSRWREAEAQQEAQRNRLRGECCVEVTTRWLRQYWNNGKGVEACPFALHQKMPFSSGAVPRRFRRKTRAISCKVDDVEFLVDCHI